MPNLIQNKLTKREYFLLIQLLAGKPKKEIISILNISDIAYERICKSILLKSGYNSLFRLITDIYFETE